jgi:hypothetical protein
VTQRIQFAPARSGLRLAYAISGSGYPVVRAPHWLTHLEADWQTPVWRRLLTDLSSRYTVVRFDQSGTGLSDPSVAAVSLDTLVDELASVVDAAGLDRFALLGVKRRPELTPWGCGGKLGLVKRRSSGVCDVQPGSERQARS